MDNAPQRPGRWGRHLLDDLGRMRLSDFKLYVAGLLLGVLTGCAVVPYHYLLERSLLLRKRLFAEGMPWYGHLGVFVGIWILLCCLSWLRNRMPVISGGGIPQARAVLNGRLVYRHPLRYLLGKFAGGVTAIGIGLSLGREGPSMQMGSFLGSALSKAFRLRNSLRKHLVAAGAGAGVAAAFTAPLSGALIIIESLERFNAPKTAMTTLLAAIVAALISSSVFSMSLYNLLSGQAPAWTVWQLVVGLLAFSLYFSLVGKGYSALFLWLKRQYPHMSWPMPLRMLAVAVVLYIFSDFLIELTGGGEAFLLDQSTHLADPFWKLLLFTLLHVLFTTFSYALGFPGGMFIPMLVTGGLMGKVYAWGLWHAGLIQLENMNYFIFLGMPMFLVAVVRTPLTAILLIAEITGHFELLFPSVIVASAIFFFTQAMGVPPLEAALYRIMVSEPPFTQQQDISIFLEVNRGCYLDGRPADGLQLPQGCQVLAVLRHGERLPLQHTRLQDGDELEVRLPAAEAEQLYEPLQSLSGPV